MQMTTIHRRNLEHREFDTYSESSSLQGNMQFQEVRFDAMQFIRCNYALSQQQHLAIDIEDEVLEMHFRLNGASCIGGDLQLDKGHHTLSVKQNHVQEVLMYPAATGAFYEIRIGRRHFEKLMDDFVPDTAGNSLPITPAMYHILAEMEHTVYAGKMKHLFLEVKMMELLILQVQQAHQVAPAFSFKHADKQKIQEARERIEHDFLHFQTIADLAFQLGINQRKLTQGFKEIFGQTIYSYVNDLRMDKAKQLLSAGNYVNEVADLIGYKNPQHFTVAFKKKFGVLPGKLKR